MTGATGLLGSHIAEKLASQDYRVQSPGSLIEWNEFLESLGVQIERGDLTNPTDCEARSGMFPWSSTVRRRLATGEAGTSFGWEGFKPRAR